MWRCRVESVEKTEDWDIELWIVPAGCSWEAHVFFFFFLALPQGMRNLISLTRDQTHAPWCGSTSLNHWTARKSQEAHILALLSPAWCLVESWAHTRHSVSAESSLAAIWKESWLLWRQHADVLDVLTSTSSREHLFCTPFNLPSFQPPGHHTLPFILLLLNESLYFLSLF